jgi:RNA polymerase sigma-70 factor (ECF subfamily)
MGKAPSPDRHPRPDWAVCLRAARAGSASALGQLLEAYRDYLLLVANQELDGDLRAKAAPSDLVQETFLEAQRDFLHFQGTSEGEWLAWLRRVLLHNLGHLRQRYRVAGKRQVAREVSLEVDDSGVPLKQELPAGIITPGTAAQAREEQAALEQALANLPEVYRQVILLRHREHRSFAEIARLLERSEDSVQKLWARAVEQLRRQLGTVP